MQPEAAVEVGDHLVRELTLSGAAAPRRSGRSAPAASRPRRPTGRTWGTCPGRSRSGRSRRSPIARAGGGRRTPAPSDPADEQAGVAGAGRVEARLDAPHQLEASARGRRPHGRPPRGSASGASSRIQRAPAGQAGQQRSHARRARASMKLVPERRAPDERAARGARPPREHRPARSGGRRPAPAHRVGRALAGALALPQLPSSSAVTSILLEARARASAPPRAGPARLARGAAAAGEESPRAPASTQKSSASSSSGARGQAREPPRPGRPDPPCGRTAVAVAAGRGCRRTLTDRISPSVPNEPQNSLARS